MAAGANDVRAGGAFYELLGVDKLSPVLARIQKKVASFTSIMQKAGNIAAIAGAGLAAPLTALFKGGADWAADLAKLNVQTGISIELLNKFQYAAQAANVSLEEVMNDTEGRYSKLMARAPAINPADARAAAQAQLEMADATRSLQLALLPMVRTLALYVKKTSEFIRNNSGAARSIAAAGAGLLAFGVTLKVTAALFSAIIPIASAAWAAMTGPIGLGIGLGLLAGSGLFLTLTYLADEWALLKEAAEEAGEIIGTTFGGISDAIMKADFALAWEIAVKSMELAWLKVVKVLTQAWIEFKVRFVDTWHDMVKEAEIALNNLDSWTSTAFLKMQGYIGNTFRAVASTILTAAISVAQTVDKLDPTSSLAGAIKMAQEWRGRLDSSRVDTAAIDADQEAKRKKKEEEIRTAADKAAVARNEGRLKDMWDAIGAVKKAEKELAELRARAALPMEDPDNPFGGPNPLKRSLVPAINVKGSFSSSALNQSLGISSDAVKQTQLLKEIVDVAKANPDAIAAKLGPVIGGLFGIK